MKNSWQAVLLAYIQWQNYDTEITTHTTHTARTYNSDDTKGASFKTGDTMRVFEKKKRELASVSPEYGVKRSWMTVVVKGFSRHGCHTNKRMWHVWEHGPPIFIVLVNAPKMGPKVHITKGGKDSCKIVRKSSSFQCMSDTPTWSTGNVRPMLCFFYSSSVIGVNLWAHFGPSNRHCANRWAMLLKVPHSFVHVTLLHAYGPYKPCSPSCALKT